MLGSIYTAAEIQRLEQGAFAAGVESATLMAKAGAGMADRILEEEPVPGLCVVYAGRGNNAGDGFVAARHLRDAGWEIMVRSLGLEGLPEGAAEPWNRLATGAAVLTEAPRASGRRRPMVLLDGLLGLGSRLPLRDDVRALTREMNIVRATTGARTYAVDLPTGLDDGGVDPDAVRAGLTHTVTFPKSSLFRDDATAFVGRIAVVDLPDLATRADALFPSDPNRPLASYRPNLRPLAPVRPFESHKGNYGRIGIVAGSRDYPGAARLCAAAAARAGAGLIYLYVLTEAHPIMAVSLPPEIIIRTVDSYAAVVHERLDAIGLGPGLGSERGPEILDLIRQFPGPMVVDADGLNLLAREKVRPSDLPHPRLLTPHPGEMERLDPGREGSRAEKAAAYVRGSGATLLLKGARTVIAHDGRPLAYNVTGTPGQATGGSGDVLTGVSAALLGRGLSPYDAARLGAWLCGRASELAVRTASEESMLPSDTIAHLGIAYRDLREVG